MSDKTISQNPNQKVEEIVKASGNSFHCNVANFFRSQGWSVLISPFYMDNYSEKPREIDLIAEKSFPIHGFFAHDLLGSVVVRLFIECKYILSETVFWFDDKDQEKAIQKTMSNTGLDHPDNNITIQSNHHLSNQKVAKLYSSSLKSPESDPFYKALNQCLNSTLYYKNSGRMFLKENRTPILNTVTYPIIICNNFSKLFGVDFTGQSLPELSEYFTLEINYAYKENSGHNREEYFLVDVVDFTNIEKYLNIVKSQDIDPVINAEGMQQRLNSISRDNVADWSIG